MTRKEVAVLRGLASGLRLRRRQYSRLWDLGHWHPTLAATFVTMATVNAKVVRSLESQSLINVGIIADSCITEYVITADGLRRLGATNHQC